jgi:imidazolonepropionase-like amidohydrolase
LQQPLLLTEARLLDIESGVYRDNASILLHGGRVAGVAAGQVDAADAKVQRLGGRFVLPGLIDAHVHAIAVADNLADLADPSPYLVAARAGTVLSGMLERGFTTVRDAGGADAGLSMAVETGHFAGPRLRVSGLALAQTGGQGDFRRGSGHDIGCPVCRGKRSITRIVDGVEGMRRAVREELKGGAHQIKVMASGGIASGIAIERPHFAGGELAAAVEEAERAGAYVMAHAYGVEAINRCLNAGVRSIEHGALLDAPTADRMAAAGAVLVPTLAVFDVLRRSAVDPHKQALLDSLLERGLGSLEIARASGVCIGHGSDLDASQQDHQLDEFRVRRAVMPAIDILRAATIGNAEVLMMKDEIGSVSRGKRADLLVYDGDPLEDIDVIRQPSSHLRMIVKDGRIVKNTLPA